MCAHNEMGGACVHLRGVNKYIQRFDGEVCSKQTTCKTYADMGG